MVAGTGIDSFLNIAIPVAIFVFFGFMVYRNFKTEIDSLIAWIKKKMDGDKKKDLQNGYYYNPYLYSEPIVYQQ